MKDIGNVYGMRHRNKKTLKVGIHGFPKTGEFVVILIWDSRKVKLALRKLIKNTLFLEN